MLYLPKIPALFRRAYGSALWRFEESPGKRIYLTFDDGPTPGVTDWVLKKLEAYDAQATFFLIGKNVRSHPDLAHQIIDAGHSVGNHTQHHINGWNSSTKKYMRDFLKAQRIIKEYTGYKTRLFRPPYGKITGKQIKQVRKSHEIVMMDVISGDFDQDLKKKKCLKNVIKNAEKGSIVLFHDSKKAKKRLKYALPRVLEHFSEKGYRFSAIPNERRPA